MTKREASSTPWADTRPSEAHADPEPRLTARQLRLITQHVPMHVSYVNKSLRYQFVNHAYEETYGRPASDIVGSHMAEVLGVQSFETARPDIARVFAGETVSVERRLTNTPAGTRFFIGHYVPDIEPDGSICGFLILAQDVTERKAAEDILQRSEERYRALFESSRDGIAFCDLEGNFQQANQAYLDMVGYSLDQLRQLKFEAITPKKWRAAEAEIISTQVMTRGYSDEYEKEYVRCDGTILPIRLRAWLIADASGCPTHLMCTVRDITEQKRASQALRDSEEKFRGLFETSHDGIGFYSVDGRIEDANPALCEIHGYERDELRGMLIRDVTPERWHERDRRGRKAVWSRGYSEEYEKEYIRPDGSIVSVSLRCWLIRDEDGTPVRELAIVRDITEQKRAKARLQQAEERLKLAAEGANDGLWDWNVQSGETYYSPRWKTMLGYEANELEPTIETWERLVHPEDRKRVDAALEGHFAGHSEHYTAQFRMRAKSGDWVWVLTRGKVFERDDDGNAVRAAGTHTDISELKRVEEALNRAKQAADVANRAKSEFLANMSHELRTPLNAIIGFADLTGMETFGPIGDSRYLDYVKDISESARHLLDLINDILDLSKIEAGKAEVAEERLDIRSLVHACITLMNERARSGEVTLRQALSESVDVGLIADRRMLKQIVINLLSNAVKFTPPGGTVTVRAWSSPEDGFVIRVEDNGIGIAADDLQKAVSRFEQVDSSLSRKYEGSGLGLPLTKSLVELHGGVLDLTSELGVGTTVTVRLPASRLPVARAAS